MKKGIAIVLCLSVLLIGVLFGCSERQNEEEPQEERKGITLSFDTTIKGFTIPSIYLDGSENDKQKFMPDTPFYVGRTFLGWYYDKDYTRLFYVTDGLTKDTTLYAKWRINVDTSELEKIPGQETDAGGLTYKKQENVYYVVGYTGALPDVTIPETFQGLPVVGIASGAFGSTIIKKISLPSSIKTVGGAFAGMTKLESVSVASSSPYYASEDGVLYSKDKKTLVCLPAAKQTTTFTLPQTIEGIEANALYGCKNELAFSQPCQVTEITEYAFSGFSGVVSVPSTVTFIQKHAFSGADCRVLFPSDCQLTAFRNGEFDGFIGAKIIVPASVTSISGAPFCDCIAAVDLSQTGLTELGENAFYRYAGAELVLPSTVNALKNGCFYQCTAQITFDERSAIQTIGESAFSNFAGKVTFPSTVKKLEKYAFYNAQSAAEIVFSSKRSEIVIDEDAFKLCKAEPVFNS